MDAGKCGEEDYSMLKDVRIRLDRDRNVGEEGSAGFSLCLWIYLLRSARPSVILRQVVEETEDEVPFLAVSEGNKLTLFPLMFLHNEASLLISSYPRSDILRITSESEFPLERWVHVGCKATTDCICLYLNGELADNMRLSSSSDDHNFDKITNVTLAGSRNNGKPLGFVYNACVLPLSATIKDDFAKNPPVKLSLNDSCASDALEVDGDGILNVVGGKLSSKSDNRLFSVCFRASWSKCYPFFEVYSPPIRCISRNRYVRPVVIGKMQTLASSICDRAPSPKINDSFQETQESFGNGDLDIVTHTKHANGLSFKRAKVGLDNSWRQVPLKGNLEEDKKVFKMSIEAKSNNLDGMDSCPSDSESIDARNSEVKWIRKSIDATSALVIFKYCLEGTYERSFLLKEIITSSSNEDLVNFADQVCLYSGCLHHRYPILMSKQLVHEGNDTWNSICQNGNRALWTTVAFEIKKRFMSISRSTTRGLSVKDLEVLRGIAGCGEELGVENFNRMWQWLYPVAIALSEVQLIGMWVAKWIEGFITVEEAEASLKGPRGIQKPGTFVLRFPTSRSWPHPDAGSLVVTYISADFTIHHKLLSIDHSNDSGSELIQNLLLKEPELSQLGRVVR